MEDKKAEQAISENPTETEIADDQAIGEGNIKQYVHTFDEPFKWEGKTYNSLHFNFDKLTGRDVLAIMQEIRLRGISVATRTFDVEYQYRYAARCCEEKIGSDVIAALPGRDFDRVCNAVQRFLVRTAL